MRIGIDGCTLMGKRSGVGRYVFELCRALDRQMPQATFFVYSPIPVELPVASERWIARVDPFWWAAKLKRVLWFKVRAGELCKMDQLDAFWASGTFLPTLAPNVNAVTTVYDLNYRMVPVTMNMGTYLAYRLFFERDVRHANRILAISHGTAGRLQQMLGLSVYGVAQPAVSSDFRRPFPEVIAATLAKLGVFRPYILAVGTLEPRKNLMMLIEVFSRLKSMGQFPQHQLVLVGGKGWKDQSLQRLLGQHEDTGVLPLGYVSDVDLPSLYSGTDAFVFPSIYEGFGMPVLEARACGARIVASDIPEIREAGGVGPLYVSPTAEALIVALPQAITRSSVAACSDMPLPGWDESARVLARALTG